MASRSATLNVPAPALDKATDRLLTVTEAADCLGAHPKTIRRWIAGGTLRALRVGPRMIRIRAADLDALRRPLGPGAR